MVIALLQSDDNTVTVSSSRPTKIGILGKTTTLKNSNMKIEDLERQLFDSKGNVVREHGN